MPLKLNPYLVEWIVLPEDAGITDEELQRAAAEVIAKMNAVIPASMFVEDLQQMDTAGEEAIYINRRTLPTLTLEMPTVDADRISIASHINGEDPSTIAIKIFELPVRKSEKPLAPADRREDIAC